MLSQCKVSHGAQLICKSMSPVQAKRIVSSLNSRRTLSFLYRRLHLRPPFLSRSIKRRPWVTGSCSVSDWFGFEFFAQLTAPWGTPVWKSQRCSSKKLNRTPKGDQSELYFTLKYNNLKRTWWCFFSVTLSSHPTLKETLTSKNYSGVPS